MAKAAPSAGKRREQPLVTGRVGGHTAKRRQPQRLIADRAKGRALGVKRAIEPIIPARRHNRVATHQEGRKLRRYPRRWIIERTNSGLHIFRRLGMRYERSATIFTPLVHLACAVTTLKRALG